MATTNNLPNGRDLQNIPSYNIRYDVQSKNNNMDYDDDGYACQLLSKIAIAVIVIIFIILIIVAITSKSMPTIYVVAPPTAKNRNNVNGNYDTVDGNNENTAATTAANNNDDDDDDDGVGGGGNDDNNDGSNNKMQKLNKNKIRKRRQTRKNPVDNFNFNDDTNNHGENIDGSIIQ